MSKKSAAVDETQFESISGTDTLSPEEREQVFQEMEAIFAKSSSNRESLTDFDMSDISTGSRFPIIFNIALFVVVGIAILSTVLLINNSDKVAIRKFNELNTEDVGAVALAQEIIAQGQAAVKAQQEELESVQAELEALRSGAGNLDEVFAGNVTARKSELDAELNAELDALRAQLENGNFSAEEIAKRVKEREEQLRQDYDAQLAAFQKEQAQAKAAREAEIQREIAALESEAKAKESAIANQKRAIEAEAQKLKQEMAAQAQAAASQLSDAQANLQALQKEKEEKQKALDRFNLLHRNIIGQIQREALEDAKVSILNARQELASNKFRNDPEFKTYFDAYNTYSVMIDGTIAAQKYLQRVSADQEASLNALKEEAEKAVAETSQLSAGLQSELQERIQKLEEQLKTAGNNLTAAEKKYKESQVDIQALSRQLNRREQEIADLQRENSNTSADLSRIRNQDIPDEITDQILNNIQYIANYLALSKSGVEDNEAKEVIVAMIDSNQLYQDVIDILILAIDPTGSLSF